METVVMGPDTNPSWRTRQSLLSRLRRWEDHESWQEFFYTYWKLIYRTAVRAGLSDAEAQEVVQETVINVARKIEGFRYDPRKDSFRGWPLQLSRRGIQKQFYRRQRAQGKNSKYCDIDPWSGLADETPDPVSQLESVWNEEWEQNLMDAAITRVKKRVAPEQFQIFNFHVLKNMPAQQVAQTLKINVARVYLAKYRLVKMLRQEIKRLERKYL